MMGKVVDLNPFDDMIRQALAEEDFTQLVGHTDVAIRETADATRALKRSRGEAVEPAHAEATAKLDRSAASIDALAIADRIRREQLAEVMNGREPLPWDKEQFGKPVAFYLIAMVQGMESFIPDLVIDSSSTNGRLRYSPVWLVLPDRFDVAMAEARKALDRDHEEFTLGMVMHKASQLLGSKPFELTVTLDKLKIDDQQASLRPTRPAGYKWQAALHHPAGPHGLRAWTREKRLKDLAAKWQIARKENGFFKRNGPRV